LQKRWDIPASLKTGFPVKKADAVRLTLAYLLIAASGREISAPKPKPKPAEAVGAATPADVPARGWLDIARSIWRKIGKNRVIAVAAGLTFYGILAIFPAVTALVSVYGLFADPAIIQNQLTHLAGVLPDGAISVIGDQVQRIAAQGHGTLGLAFISGLVVALWSANAGVKALFDALNVAYETEETRGFFLLNAISLSFTISAVALALVGLSSTVILPWALEHVFSASHSSRRYFDGLAYRSLS
jgi:membrane protein